KREQECRTHPKDPTHRCPHAITQSAVFVRRRSAFVIHACAALLVVTRVTTSAAQSPSPPALRVRGAVHLEAHASRAAQGLLLDGRLIDDAGAPLGETPLFVSVDRGGERVSVQGRSCAARDKETAPSPELQLRTEEGGRYCVLLPLALVRYVVHARTEAT